MSSYRYVLAACQPHKERKHDNRQYIALVLALSYLNQSIPQIKLKNVGCQVAPRSHSPPGSGNNTVARPPAPLCPFRQQAVEQS
jgi:hypothetical protein